MSFVMSGYNNTRHVCTSLVANCVSAVKQNHVQPYTILVFIHVDPKMDHTESNWGSFWSEHDRRTFFYNWGWKLIYLVYRMFIKFATDWGDACRIEMCLNDQIGVNFVALVRSLLRFVTRWFIIVNQWYFPRGRERRLCIRTVRITYYENTTHKKQK